MNHNIAAQIAGLTDYRTDEPKGDVMKQSEIVEKIESLVPAKLLLKYCGLSYGELAEIEEMELYAHELREAERMWFEEDVDQMMRF